MIYYIGIMISGLFVIITYSRNIPISQWEFQDPKMEVLYHIRPYFVGIFPYIALT